MRTMGLLALVVTMGGVASAHPEGDEVLRFKQHGFSIRPLKSKSADNLMTQVVSMQMAPTDGFATNVNVQVQPFPDSIDDYIKLSKGQFDQFGFKVLSQKKIDENTVTLEYTGKMQNTDLHWYARATRKKGRPVIYLVTGTATAAQWTAMSAALKDCVDSLKLD
jgi:hypothetical protein